ncbi:MAG: DMT family transporter [Pseudomonadota bacterium]
MSSLVRLVNARTVVATMTPAPSDRAALWRGVAWMLFAMSCIALIDGGAKLLAVDRNGIQIAWGYFIAMLANLLIYAAIRRLRFRDLLHTQQRSKQLLRAAFLVGSLSCLFFSLRYLPLAEATSISFTAPLFVVALAGPLLKERVSWSRWLAVLCGLAGALIIVRPGSDVLGWAAFLPLIGAVFFALFSIVTRMLGPNENIITTVFYTTGGGSILLSLATPLFWEAMNWPVVAALFGLGTLGIFAHLSIVQAMRLVDASRIAPINYVRLVWALGLGWLLFGQTPDAMALFGAVIIVASGLYVVMGPR